MKKVSAIFVLDISRSMMSGMTGEPNPAPGQSKWEVVSEAITHFIASIEPDSAECAIIEFGQQSQKKASFTNNKDSLIQMASIEPAFQLTTNYNSAFLRNRVEFNGNVIDDSTNSSLYLAKFAKYKPVIIFMTDGKHNPSNYLGEDIPFLVGAASNLAKARNAYVFVINIGTEYLDAPSLNNLTTMAEVEGKLSDNLYLNVTSKEELLGLYDKVKEICGKFSYQPPCEVAWESECSGGGNLILNFPSHGNLAATTTFEIPEYDKPVLEMKPVMVSLQIADINPKDTIVQLIARNKSIDIPANAYISTDPRYSIVDWGAKGNPPITIEKDSSIMITVRYTPTDLTYTIAELVIEGNQCSGELIVVDANKPSSVIDKQGEKGNSIIKSISPNPASGLTEVCFYLSDQAIVKSWITDILGNKVLEMDNRIIDSGDNSIYFNADRLNNGVFFIIMQTPTQLLNKRFNIIK
ncbi:MAG: VWA domain-containing protein [Ignavibacteriae bacterium]|nr:VWA domain-containing protein [Ignavibacteriota bacterium]